MAEVSVHLVFPHGSEAVRAAVAEMAAVTGWDTSLDLAAQWALSRQPPAPDVIIVNGGVDVSLVDTKTGKRLPWNTAFVQRLRDIRLSRPSARLVVLLPPEKEREREFVAALVALGIYDLYFQKEFGKDDLKRWLTAPKTLADVQHFLPQGGGGTGEEPPPVVLAESEKRKRIGLNLKGLAGALRRSEPEAKTVGEETPPPAAPETPVETPVAAPESRPVSPADGLGEGLCLLGVKGFVPGAVEAPSPAALLKLAADCWGAVIGADTPGITRVIADLRRQFPGLAIGVLGPERQDYYAAGADECLPALDGAALRRLKKRAERMQSLLTDATKDALTGCHGRRFLEDYLSDQADLYRREKVPVSVLICDLDHFKSVNDTHGHQAGDEVLRRFGSFLRQQVRDVDVVARYGGEEFVVVFPRTRKEEALETADRLRRGWERGRVYDSTFSGGVAELGLDASDVEGLIAAADRALYRAKNEGRNRVLPVGQETVGTPPERRIPGRIPFDKARLRTCVLAVVGANRRVGATAFALALADALAGRRQVEVLDAGGGASVWLKGGSLPCRKAPPFSVVAGVVTVVDCGVKLPEEILPLAEKVFIVTDMSPAAVQVKPVLPGQTYLVGNRGASMNALRGLASLWGLEVLCAFPEDAAVREAEIRGEPPRIRRWYKELKGVV